MPVSSTSYKPGQSGNPGGLKTDIKLATQQIRESCIEIAQRGIKVLERILFNEDEKSSIRMAALNIFLERGLGKPLQAIQIESSEGIPPAMMTTAQLHAVIAGKFEDALAMGMKDGSLQEKIRLWEIPQACEGPIAPENASTAIAHDEAAPRKKQRQTCQSKHNNKN